MIFFVIFRNILTVCEHLYTENAKNRCSENVVFLKFQELDSCWGPDNFEVSWDARDGHENLAEASGTEKRFAGAPLPRSLKVQSWEIGNANTPRSQKVQSWPTGNANRQPPYWWCLVCRTASRGASSLGCLRTSRWSKFVVEMWIFKIDLKFRFEFFCCGMQSCAHHFSHTGRSKIKVDDFAVPWVSLHVKMCKKNVFFGE